MQIRNIILAGGLAIGLANLGGAAFAQKVVVVDEDAVFKGSKIGGLLAQNVGAYRAAVAEKLGLKTLQDELKADEAAIPQLKTMTPDALNAAVKTDAALKAKLEALAKKQNELEVKANQFGGASNQQANAAQSAFAYVLGPAVEYVAKQEAADVVLSAGATLYFGKKPDISSKVIARLDATVATLDALNALLPKPPQQAGGAAPAAPASAPPAVPAPAPAKPPGQ